MKVNLIDVHSIMTMAKLSEACATKITLTTQNNNGTQNVICQNQTLHHHPVSSILMHWAVILCCVILAPAWSNGLSGV